MPTKDDQFHELDDTEFPQPPASGGFDEDMPMPGRRGPPQATSAVESTPETFPDDDEDTESVRRPLVRPRRAPVRAQAEPVSDDLGFDEASEQPQEEEAFEEEGHDEHEQEAGEDEGHEGASDEGEPAKRGLPISMGNLIQYGGAGVAGLALLWFGYTIVLPQVLGSSAPAPQQQQAAIPVMPRNPLANAPSPAPNAPAMQPTMQPNAPSLPPAKVVQTAPQPNPGPATPLTSPKPAADGGTESDRIATLETQIKQLQLRLSAPVGDPAGPLIQMRKQLADIETRLSSLETRPVQASTPRPAVEPPAKPKIMPDWKLTAVLGDSAYISGPDGTKIKVQAGTDVPALGVVRAITQYEGEYYVVTDAGLVARK